MSTPKIVQLSQTSEHDLTVLMDNGQLFHRVVGLIPPAYLVWGTLRWDRIPGPFDPLPDCSLRDITNSYRPDTTRVPE